MVKCLFFFCGMQKTNGLSWCFNCRSEAVAVNGIMCLLVTSSGHFVRMRAQLTLKLLEAVGCRLSNNIWLLHVLMAFVSHFLVGVHVGRLNRNHRRLQIKLQVVCWGWYQTQPHFKPIDGMVKDLL
jgi:hypothetical protein